MAYEEDEINVPLTLSVFRDNISSVCFQAVHEANSEFMAFQVSSVAILRNEAEAETERMYTSLVKVGFCHCNENVF